MAWIDLRQNLAGLINGDLITIPQGYWAIVRIFRWGQFTPYWHEDTKEAIGGPKYYYDDFLIRVISMPGQRFTGMRGLMQGINVIGDSIFEDSNNEVFAIEYNPFFPRYPENNDIIYKISEFESVEPPLPPYRAEDRFVIKNRALDHGDYGRAEILLYLGTREHGES